MDPIVDLVVRAAVAALFLVATGHKLHDFGRFRATLADHRLVPASLVTVAAILVIAAELVVTVLLPGRWRAIGLAAAASLLVVYAAAIAVNLWRGRRHIDCGCVGFGGREEISWWLVARNLVLALAALGATGPVTERALVWVDACTLVGALAALVALYAASDGLLANRPGYARMRGAA